MVFHPAHARRRAACLAVAAVAAAAACRDLAFEPQDPATVAFAPSLGVNLSQFTRLPNGVYIRDLAVGVGTAVDSNSSVAINYRGALPNGFVFDSTYATQTRPLTPLALLLVPGARAGLLGARQGTRRQLIVPPGLAYGNRTRPDNSVPAGSVVFYDVNLVNVVTPVDTTRR